MKRILCIILTALCLMQANVFAEENIKVTLNGELIEFDVPPQIINERTMVPMRKIFESLGAKVNWVEEAQLIIASKNADIIAMEIGKDSFYITNVISGEGKEITLDVPPQIVEGRTLVPVRAISESLGLNVAWDSETETVIIESEI